MLLSIYFFVCRQRQRDASDIFLKNFYGLELLPEPHRKKCTHVTWEREWLACWSEAHVLASEDSRMLSIMDQRCTRWIWIDPECIALRIFNPLNESSILCLIAWKTIINIHSKTEYSRNSHKASQRDLLSIVSKKRIWPNPCSRDEEAGKKDAPSRAPISRWRKSASRAYSRRVARGLNSAWLIFWTELICEDGNHRLRRARSMRSIIDSHRMPLTPLVLYFSA